MRGADYTTYGDSVIVAVAEPLSLGGVDDAPAWLGEPIAEGVIDSLASEVKVYRVPDDRELPDADEQNTFLLVQVRGARLIQISSSGIGVHVPQDDVQPFDDPFDLQSQATEFAQGYLDALAEGRWEDAATYIDERRPELGGPPGVRRPVRTRRETLGPQRRSNAGAPKNATAPAAW